MLSPALTSVFLLAATELTGVTTALLNPVHHYLGLPPDVRGRLNERARDRWCSLASGERSLPAAVHQQRLRLESGLSLPFAKATGVRGRVTVLRGASDRGGEIGGFEGRPGEQLQHCSDVVDRDQRPAAVAASRVSAVAGAAALAAAVVLGLPFTADAAAPGWVEPTKFVLDPLLLYFEFAFLARIVLSWYPALDLNRVPQNFVAWPTEPILRPTRAVVPPAFGVDISPIVWVMICSFVHEILLGQQGILNLMSNK